MSPKPFPNADPTIAIKRTRAPVRPFATRGALEQAIAGLVDKGPVLELSPPSEWRIHPSTEARGSSFQHERLVWGINYENEWATVITPQTFRGPQEERASREATSPTSIPTSPNYFDLR